MRPSYIFITCLVLFSFCSVASQLAKGPVKCCFSFTNARIPLKQVKNYQITHLDCRLNGVIFSTKAGREICTDPSERWVQRLMTLVDFQNLKQMTAEGVMTAEGCSGDSS